ncbi:MAG: type II secretion system protein N [Betaproteobacteria bacterium]|nr:type II secretion system protein N [Betaproteobacteria bacterium]
MKRWIWIAAGLLAGVFAFWPAASFESRVRTALPPGSDVALTGSVWSGAGRIHIGGAAWPVSWQFQPGRLLQARAAWRIEARPAGAHGDVVISIGWGGAALDSPAFEGELRTLYAVLPGLKLMGVAGQVKLTGPDLRVTLDAPWRAQGVARLALRDVSVTTLGPAPLGQHEIELKGTGEEIAFEIARSDGLLKLDGKGTYNARGEYGFQGSALPLASFDADARARLARVATAQSDGRFRFDVRGTW